MDTLVLQGYMNTTLKAFAPLAALIAGRVYDSVPQPSPQFPYVTIGIAQAIDQSRTECVTDWEVFAQIDVWSRATGYPEAKKIAKACDDALAVRWPALTGMRTGWFEVTNHRFFRDPDGITSHGVLEYRARYGPAS